MAYRRDRSSCSRSPIALALPLAAILLLVTTGERAEAQEVESPYEFFDHRWEFSAGIQHWETDTGQFDLAPSSGTGAVARVGYHLAGPFTLEGVGSLVPTSRSVVEPTSPGDNGNGPQAVGQADVLMATGEARLRFHVTGDRTWNDLAPYASAGVGVSNDFEGHQTPDEELSQSDRFNFGPTVTGYLGLGSQWFAGDRFLVQADVGVNAWRMSNPTGFQDLAGQGDIGSVDENEWLLNPGLTVTLGVRR